MLPAPQSDTNEPAPHTLHAVTSAGDAVRQARVAEALGLMIHEGYSQRAACERVGMDPKTFRELARGSEALALLRRATEDALLDGLLVAQTGYARYIQRLVDIVSNAEAYPRDVIAAGKELQAILVRFVGVMPQAPGGQLTPQAPVAISFEGPVTMKVVPQSDSLDYHNQPRLLKEEKLDDDR